MVERLDVLGVLPEGEFDLGLLDHRVDAAQPVGFRVGQQVEAAERVVEIAQRLAVGPAALRFFRCQNRIIDRLLGLVAAAEMERQQFCHFVGATFVELLERLSDGAVIGAAVRSSRLP